MVNLAERCFSKNTYSNCKLTLTKTDLARSLDLAGVPYVYFKDISLIGKASGTIDSLQKHFAELQSQLDHMQGEHQKSQEENGHLKEQSKTLYYQANNLITQLKESAGEGEILELQLNQVQEELFEAVLSLEELHRHAEFMEKSWARLFF